MSLPCPYPVRHEPAGLREYADLGVGTLIVSLEPTTPESVAALGRAAALSRA